jgi:hypothetical protein
MKDWKLNALIGMVAIIALSFCIVACGGGGGDGNQTPMVGDFNISGTGTFDYDGTAKIVTIKPKPDKSTGAITVYYNGSVTAPIAINSYSVTFDVAEAEGFNAENELVAGTLTIDSSAYGIPVTAENGITITAAHLATIKAAIDWLIDQDVPNHAKYIKNNVKEFRIIPGTGTTWVGMDNGKLIAKIPIDVLEHSTALDDIGGALYFYIEDNNIDVTS